MIVFYENHKVAKLKFGFKLDPVENDYLPHIFVRHLISPEKAILAYLNITHKKYNETHKRWEAYSENEDLFLYYMQLSKNYIFIISAFKN